MSQGKACSGGGCNCEPSYEAWIWSPRDGRKIRKTFPTLAAAKAWRSDAQVALRKGEIRAPSPLTLEQAGAAWLEGAKTGSVRNRRVAVKVPETEGLPDGMTVDAEGFLWSAQWYGSCVVRYDPDGRAERRINIPAKQTSSLAFGGEELADIFVTSASRSFPTPLMPADYDPASGYFGGRLYHINLGIRGKPEFKADLMRSPR